MFLVKQSQVEVPGMTIDHARILSQPALAIFSLIDQAELRVQMW
jgi:hypothetical protein